jgi:hypothetical protein
MVQTVTDGILPASRRFGIHNFFHFFSKKIQFFRQKIAAPGKEYIEGNFFDLAGVNETI